MIARALVYSGVLLFCIVVWIGMAHLGLYIAARLNDPAILVGIALLCAGLALIAAGFIMRDAGLRLIDHTARSTGIYRASRVVVGIGALVLASGAGSALTIAVGG
ncbi:MAG TPA: hypothetical protein PKY87_12835 [Terricaulis sp.]|nr:hypothetical protein [Terricaulis sp.]